MDSAIEPYVQAFHLHEHLNADLLRCAKLLKFPAQYELYTPTREQTFLYLLVAGSLQVNHYHPNGKLSVLATMTPLDVIGDLELFSPEQIKTSAVTQVVTREASILIGIEKVFALRYGYDDPRFLRFIIQNIAQKLYQTSFMQVGNILPLPNRFAVYLLEKSDAAGWVDVPSKEDWAGLLNTTPRHLNRIIKTFQEQGVIRVDRSGLQILERQALAAVADE